MKMLYLELYETLSSLEILCPNLNLSVFMHTVTKTTFYCTHDCCHDNRSDTRMLSFPQLEIVPLPRCTKG